jgi:hypothetical protein
MYLLNRFTISILLAGIIALPLLSEANEVTSFTLVNATTNEDIQAIEDGALIGLTDIPATAINIRANASSATISSITISLTGDTVTSRTEAVAPYALWGDNGGDYLTGTLNSGFHTLSATAVVNGIAGPSHTVTFTVSDAVTGIPVANAGSDQYVVIPDNTISLTGVGYDDDGIITDYQWNQVNGPNAVTASGEDSPIITLSSLIEGTYTMRLTVTDNDGNTAYDDVFITVMESTSIAVTGELKKWHTVTLTLNGPATSETATPNPFTDYRFDVLFSNGSKNYSVPGYFAADGDSGNSGSSSGNKWRVHFTPDEVGTWSYHMSFREGENVIGSVDPLAGTAVASLDGLTGSFVISQTDKTGRDHRGKGRLQYVGNRYLRFAETGEYFLKQGADSPENFLAYDDFDNTPNNGGRRKSWSAHVDDWKNGDPTWMGEKGKGIIGALNYLASEGMNAFSFIPMNIGGDDRNVFPYVSDAQEDRTRLDVSKLDQWEQVFKHADRIGMFLHFKTQETENELLLDGGNLGIERKVYYRELIARFGHHLALNWNLGEEVNNASTLQKKAWAQYIFDTDPYHHHIVIHNMNDPHYDLLGVESKLTGFSLQTSNADFSAVHTRVKDYLSRSAEAGKPWAVACDEPGDAGHAIRPDYDAGNSHEDGRKNGLWGTLMAGGWGNEWYFGYQHDHSDLTCQDFRSRDNWWDYSRIALDFFTTKGIPFWRMKNDNAVSSAGNDYCLYELDKVYVVYLKAGGTTDLDLREATGMFEIKWYDPRNGGGLWDGSKSSVVGGGWVNLGYPPNSPVQDWVLLVQKPDNYSLMDSIIILQVLVGLEPASPEDLILLSELAINDKLSIAQVIQILRALADDQ